MELEEFLQVGVTTKDRWDDLLVTLSQIEKSELRNVEVLVHDDGSTERCPYDVSMVCKNAKLVRFEEPLGYIAQRNLLCKDMTKPYYLSIDDDSYPVGGGLLDALSFMVQSGVGILAFPIYNPRLKAFQVSSDAEEPYQVRSFVGCAHVLDRTAFLELGGYREELVHFGEELDLSARFFGAGLKVMHYPGILFHHTASTSSRDWWRMDYYGARNPVLWNDWYLPRKMQVPRILRGMAGKIIAVLKTRRLGHVAGFIEGVRLRRSLMGNRLRFSDEEYERWLSLPLR